METDSASVSSRGIKSVEIGYKVLLAVQRGPVPVQLTEIARRSGLTTGAVHNYLVSLVRVGLVEQESRGSYKLGPSAFALSLSSFDQLEHYDMMKDATLELARASGFSSAAAIWSQGGPVSVFQVPAGSTEHFEFRSGLLTFERTAAAKTFGACLPQSTALPVLEDELRRSGRREVDATSLLETYRRELSDRGFTYASNLTDTGDRSAAMGAPVLDRSGQIRFSLSILGMAGTLAPDDEENCVRPLLNVCEKYTNIMRYAA